MRNYEISYFLAMGDLSALWVLSKVLAGMVLLFFVFYVLYKDLAFNGRIKYTGDKSLDLFTYPLPGKKNGVALTSLPGCNCSCSVHRGEMAH